MLDNNGTGIIYKATCTETGFAYVGQTTKSLAVRKQKHFQKAFGGSNTPFHRAIREHGEDAFVWEVLADEVPADKLGSEEQSYIAAFDTIVHGYNANSGGGGKKATPQLQPSLRWVSESDLTLHWELNRRCNEKHVYALAQRMQAIGGFDSDYPIGTIEIDGELHVYSGHHRVAAAFSRDIVPYQFYPLLPLEKVPVTVIQGDEDTLIEKMWTTHLVSNSEDGTLSLSERLIEEALCIVLAFPHFYRLSPRKLSKMWNVPPDWIRSSMSYISQDISMISFQRDYLISSERAMALKRIINVRDTERILQSGLPTPPDIPEQQIQWLNECLTLALPNSTDRLAALQMLLKRLAEDL